MLADVTIKRWLLQRFWSLQLPYPTTDAAMQTVDIRRRENVERAEELLEAVSGRFAQGARRWVIRLAAHSTGDILADVWAAIAVGTICRNAAEATIVTWGSSTPSVDFERSSFAHSLPGLVGIQMAEALVTDGDHTRIDTSQVERAISLRDKGIAEVGGGATRALVEFDPQQPVALALKDERAGPDALETRRILFGQTLSRFRSELEVGNIVRGHTHAEAGAAKALSTFLNELHDNAYEHGRAVPGKSIRYLRLRKHVAKNRDELVARAGSIAPLRDYVTRTAIGNGPQAVIEAIISDFGPGIVDHFLGSSEGQGYQNGDRRQLLHRIIVERLSAKGADPAAGLGIQRALKAAKEMAGFAALRTGEFWLAQSYADPASPIHLEDVGGGPRGPVAGTHWQFIWPQPL